MALWKNYANTSQKKENARICTFLPQSVHKHQDRCSPKDRTYWEETGNVKNNGGKLREHSKPSISLAMRTFLTFLSSLPEFKCHSKGLGHRQGYRLGRFFLRAEEGVTLQSLIVLALDNVSKHFVVHLVCSAIRYSVYGDIFY